MHVTTLLVTGLIIVTTLKTISPTLPSIRPLDGSVIKVVVTGGSNASTYNLTSTETTCSCNDPGRSVLDLVK